MKLLADPVEVPFGYVAAVIVGILADMVKWVPSEAAQIVGALMNVAAFVTMVMTAIAIRRGKGESVDR